MESATLIFFRPDTPALSNVQAGLIEDDLANSNDVERLATALIHENQNDYKAAAEIYISLLEKGNVKAYNQLLSMLRELRGTQQVFDYCIEEVNGKSPATLWVLGTMYLYGYGIGQNFLLACENFEKSALQGFAAAYCGLGKLHYYGYEVEQNYATASGWFKKAIEQNFVPAWCDLGILYSRGNGVTKNYASAFNYFEKAAEHGVSEAWCELALLYYKGHGVARDYVIAREYFEKVEKELAQAQYNLGFIYEYGQGVTQDNSRALEYYKKAAARKSVAAKGKILKMCLDGRALKIDVVFAFRQLAKAAKEGNIEARNKILEIRLNEPAWQNQ